MVSIKNWTKFAAGFCLVFLAMGLVLRAQSKSDPILDGDGVSSLFEELKEGLPEFISDEEKVTAIAEKWEAREDLEGKTRYGVIRLIIDDVRAVIKDEKIALKIWHKWNGVKEDPEVAPKVEPKRKPAIWIKFVQNGWYIAHFALTWDEPGKPNLSWNASNKTKDWMDVAYIPGEATNIRLKIQNDTGLVWQPQKEIFNRVLQPADVNKCYRVTGTTLGSAYDNDCQ